ncbi:MAG: DCC1-like thiol-disulfide oxidoreductase family protein [Bacteroidales bacterium]|jgi:predicted DCC family thiol-disulfide oxidoreductase YuxK|nr:DCC1-like thiol-disulfide oxidoreductase family protein [Bacteroidales bacterium]
MQNPLAGSKIVFFDGYCLLCNRAVDYLLKKDKNKILKFASLQTGPVTELVRQEEISSSADTVIFYDEGKVYIKSSAVLRIAGYLGFPLRLLACLIVVPRPIRDQVYDYVARNRSAWFGKKEFCRVPDEETSGRIIV